MIKDGTNGYLTDIGNVDALAEKCLSLLGQPDIANKFKEQSFDIVTSQFDLKNLEENYYNFYTHL